MTPPGKQKTPASKKIPMKRNLYSEEQMKSAINAVRSGQSPFAVAKAFNVPRATLISKIEGKYESETCEPYGYFNVAEVKMLTDWMKARGNAGFPITKAQLLDSV